MSSNRNHVGRPALGPGQGRQCPTHSIRCSQPAWEWLKNKAQAAGHTSVGAWAEASVSPVSVPPAGVDVGERRVESHASPKNKRPAPR